MICSQTLTAFQLVITAKGSYQCFNEEGGCLLVMGNCQFFLAHPLHTFGINYDFFLILPLSKLYYKVLP